MSLQTIECEIWTVVEQIVIVNPDSMKIIVWENYCRSEKYF